MSAERRLIADLHNKAHAQFTEVLTSLEEFAGEQPAEVREVLWQFFLHGAEWMLNNPVDFKH